MNKKIITLLFVMLIFKIGFSQAPQAIPYQAVVRDSSGKLLRNHAVKLRFTIYDSITNGNVLYQETHYISTNRQGLVITNIGQGISNTGTFSDINWGKNNKFVQTELSINNDNNFTDLGTTQFLSVPYALHSATAEKLAGTLPAVQTIAVTNISYRSASISANLVSKGGKLLLAKGICYSTSPNPTEDNALIATGSTLGVYTLTLDSLTPSTTYYARAFATTTAGTSYGTEISFTTNALLVPAINTLPVGNISNTSVYASALVTDNGGANITQRGFVWATTNNPTTSNNVLSVNSSSDSFATSITGLNPATTYYLRAYATNAQGTAYGNTQSFTTNTITLASVTTSEPSNVSFTSATVGGQVTSDGGNAVTGRGICYSTTANPTISSSVLTSGSGVGTFSMTLNNLLPNTLYYVRAYATNAGGTAYGLQQSFTTLAKTLPVLTTTGIYAISSNTAAGGGNISSDGGSAITVRGICWDTLPNPTTDKPKTMDGAGSGVYNSSLSNLALGTTYYVRAYAINDMGTAYGNQVSFTTSSLLLPPNAKPTIGTTAVTKTDSNYVSGGYISNDGGSAIIQQGICWNEAGNPTISDSILYYTTTGTGFFSQGFNLPPSCNSTWYVRAFAINVSGISYGNQVSVQTGLSPRFTATISNINGNSATMNVNISNDGGCSVTERGVVWSTSPNPTTSSFKTTCGMGTGAYSCNLQNLISNTLYYVRAYAVTAMGTFYGEQQNFTSAINTSLGIGQTYAGGIIFYLDSTGQHGLVCAPSDQGSYPWGYPWGCYSTSIPGTSAALGTGAVNTAAIVAGCTETNTAAKICDDLVLNGYSDWFLPSRDELYLMYQQLKVNGIGNFTTDVYWSSSERYISGSWDVYFGDGGFWGGYNKNSHYSVRAVRAF